jgi:hypothetical protein
MEVASNAKFASPLWQLVSAVLAGFGVLDFLSAIINRGASHGEIPGVLAVVTFATAQQLSTNRKWAKKAVVPILLAQIGCWFFYRILRH